ncbi:GPR1/FUN34/yaaH family-domain-containing protein [Usnea florida]
MNDDRPLQNTVDHNEPSLEKDFSNGYSYGHGNMNNNNLTMGAEESNGGALNRIRTAGSISMSPELFEKLYLSPENRVKGDLRKTFGNPTPIALIGFLLSLTPLSCDLMGWRGAGGNGASDTAAYFFFGGVLMILGAIGEWIVGNTFPFVVFGTFGAFWLTFGGTLVPSFNAYGAYVTSPTQMAGQDGNPGNPLGLQQPAFNASFAFFLVFMGLVCLIFLICSVRTNITFFLIFFTLVCAFGCLSGAYWNLALAYENPTNTMAAARAGKLAGGAFTFVTSLAGWWIFFAIMLASLDFPFSLPVGDLSHIVKGASEKQKVKDAV